ncbi:MAG: lysine 6-dehydrogenase [Planctomycetota bacterium]|jgi:lysine 6-dehydrogenase
MIRPMSKTQIIVLGAGRVGSAIALDLGGDSNFAVTVADFDTGRGERFQSVDSVQFVQADLSDATDVQKLVAPFDLVVGAVPGWMGYATLKAVIEAGKNAVDISFFEQDPFELDELAKQKGVTCVVDCGVAPGLSNLVLGRMEQEFDSIDNFVCFVGGLPENPTPPWNYKAPYSPTDVIEMYTRPARLVRDKKIVTVDALTENELLEFEGVGTLEAFNTDGLRTLLTTTSVTDLKEKTLRYPGNRDALEILAKSGFFDDEREVGGTIIRPREITSKLLFEQWFQGKEDYDITVMRLIFEGVCDGKQVTRTFDMCDKADRVGSITSMARTTAYPCTAVARLIASGTYTRKGISPPEFIGADSDCYDAIMSDLKQRDVEFKVAE